MAGLPEFLTVPEAARVIRVGRTKAYAMTVEWRATEGRSGLPVVDFGHTLRVPRHALEQLAGAHLDGGTAGTGAGGERDGIGDPDEVSDSVPPPDVPPDPEQDTPRSDPPSRTRSARSRRPSVRPSNQLDLFELPPSAPRP